MARSWDRPFKLIGACPLLGDRPSSILRVSPFLGYAPAAIVLPASANESDFMRDVRLVRNGCTHIGECWRTHSSLENVEKELEALDWDSPDIFKLQEVVAQFKACDVLKKSRPRFDP